MQILDNDQNIWRSSPSMLHSPIVHPGSTFHCVTLGSVDFYAV